jgi:hypothetical protein
LLYQLSYRGIEEAYTKSIKIIQQPDLSTAANPDPVTWAPSWLAKFETAKVGDGFIEHTRFDKSLNTANSSA